MKNYAGEAPQHIDDAPTFFNRYKTLKETASWAGLLAVWHLEDGESPDTALTIATITLEQLRATT